MSERIHAFGENGELSEGARLALDAYWLANGGGDGGGGGGVTVHGELTGRSEPNQHPIGAITGLTATLANKSDVDHKHVRDAVAQEIDPNGVVASTTKVKVPLPTHPTAAQQTTHPSVVYIEDGWNGYTYWMAATPYPFANDSWEDPSIFATNDPLGEWVVPPGQVNPVHDAPGKAFGSYNADTELYLGPDNRMHLYWKNNVGDTSERIMYSSSTTGTSWSTPQVLFSGPVGTAVSPCVSYLDGVWYMWSVNLHFVKDGGDGVKRMERRTASSPTGPWSVPVGCTFSPNWPADRHPWHPGIIRYGALWIGVMNDCQAGSNGGDGDHYFITSRDGLNWSRADNVLHPREVTGEYTRLYRPTIVPTVRDGVQGFEMWYGAINAAFEWWTYRTHLSLAPMGGMASRINFAYGTWNYTAAKPSSGTAPSDKFYFEWANGVCVVHIDLIQVLAQSSAASHIYGLIPSEVPIPRRVAESMIVPPTGVAGRHQYGVYVFARPDRQIRGVGTLNERTIAHIVYHYD